MQHSVNRNGFQPVEFGHVLLIDLNVLINVRDGKFNRIPICLDFLYVLLYLLLAHLRNGNEEVSEEAKLCLELILLAYLVCGSIHVEQTSLEGAEYDCFEGS